MEELLEWQLPFAGLMLIDLRWKFTGAPKLMYVLAESPLFQFAA